MERKPLKRKATHVASQNTSRLRMRGKERLGTRYFVEKGSAKASGLRMVEDSDS
jgi:hypothetical protein